MSTDNKIHQQRPFDSTGLLPKKNWKSALWHIALLVVVVFITEITAAQADMVFDFQMKLAQKGNAEAQFKVGEMYESGRGVEKNMIEAKRWINKAAAQGNQAAGYKLLYYDLQQNGVTRDNKAKLGDLQDAARDGDGYAQYYVGLMHSRGVGLSKNSNAALDWLGKASLVGVTAAEAEIARVNEVKQSAQLRAKKEAERKLRAQEEARRQQEAKRKQEERMKLEAQREQEKRKQQDIAGKNQAEDDKKRAQKREADRIAAEKEAQKLQLIAQREAEAEQKRQAVMAQRKKKEEEKKAQFESDPCSGKSARFLSTCR
jgi:flagellar biosynthesis GTPase FlhF